VGKYNAEQRLRKDQTMPQKPTTITKELLKAIRDAEKRGITRYQIAKVSGVSEAQLSKMVKRLHVPKIDTAEKIAKALGLKIVLVSPEENT